MNELFYESDIERQLEILSLKTDITIESAINEYKFEESVFEESEENSDKGFKNAIQKIIDAILGFLSDVTEAIRNAFSTKGRASTDALLNAYSDNSEDFQVRMQHDLDQVHKTVNDEVRKGSELIQKISKGTHIPDTVVQDFVHNGPKKIAMIVPVSIGAVAAVKCYNKYSKDNVFKSVTDSVKNIKDTVNAPDAKAKDKISSILTAMYSIIRSGANTTVEGLRAIDREATKASKRNK